VPEVVAVDMGPAGETDAGVMGGDAATPLQPDAGTGGDDPGFATATGGCSCRATGDSPIGSAGPLVLVLFVLGRRRR
jgi:MYXO-CTERM domain-containing protein